MSASSLAHHSAGGAVHSPGVVHTSPHSSLCARPEHTSSHLLTLFALTLFSKPIPVLS